MQTGPVRRRAGLAAGREGGAEAELPPTRGGRRRPISGATADNRLLVTVAEPVMRNRHTVGIVQLTRDAREVDDSLVAIRMSILGLFVIALVLTVMLSWYLSLTIARPILRLSQAARDMREGHGRAGAVPPSRCCAAATRSANWRTRCATVPRRCGRAWMPPNGSPPTWRTRSRTRSAAIRSAIETLRRIEDAVGAAAAAGDHRGGRDPAGPADQRHQRCEPGGCRAEPGGAGAGGRGGRSCALLVEIDEATRPEGGVRLEVDAPDGPMLVQAVEDRLVQVLRNLIGNAQQLQPGGRPGGAACPRSRRHGRGER